MKLTALRSVLYASMPRDPDETQYAPITNHLSDLSCLYPNDAPLYLPTLPLMALYERASMVAPDRYVPENFMVPGKGPRPLLEQLGRIRQSRLIVPTPDELNTDHPRGPQQFTLSHTGETIMRRLRSALNTRYRAERTSWHRLYNTLSDEFNQVTTPMLVVTLGVQQGWATRNCLTDLLCDTPMIDVDDILSGAVDEGLLVENNYGMIDNGPFPSRTYDLTHRGHHAVLLARDL